MRRRRAGLVAVFAIATCAACNSLLGIDPLDAEDASVDASIRDVASSSDVSPRGDASDAPTDAPAEADGNTDAADATDATDAAIAGDGAVGEPCTFTPCATGLACVAGVCHLRCASAGAACSPTTTCVQHYDQNHVAVPGELYCEQTSCDLLDAASCGPSDAKAPIACYFSRSDLARDCIQMGTSTTTCPGGVTDCAPGRACYCDGGPTCGCDRWCSPAHPCEGGLTCDTLQGLFVIDGSTWGVCD